MAKAKLRARRTARAILHGEKIYKIVNSEEVRNSLIAAVMSGHPPVSAISNLLLEALPHEDLKLTPLKQFIGLCVRAVLEEEGFEVETTGVRLSNDPVFRTGSVYKKSVTINKSYETIQRIIRNLPDDEAIVALDILMERGLKIHPAASTLKPKSQNKKEK